MNHKEHEVAKALGVKDWLYYESIHYSSNRSIVLLRRVDRHSLKNEYLCTDIGFEGWASLHNHNTNARYWTESVYE